MNLPSVRALRSRLERLAKSTRPAPAVDWNQFSVTSEEPVGLYAPTPIFDPLEAEIAELPEKCVAQPETCAANPLPDSSNGAVSAAPSASGVTFPQGYES